MTIASEISRLQADKECIRQAIISKGVNISTDLSINCYANCISSIDTDGGFPIKVLLVGGGAAGGFNNTGCLSRTDGASGGGGGEVLANVLTVAKKENNIVVGCGGVYGRTTSGGASCFGSKKQARGGCYPCAYVIGGTSGNGNRGGCGKYCSDAIVGGGGGGAGGIGCNRMNTYTSGNGGPGICGYGGGGGGGGLYEGCGCDGGGNGAGDVQGHCPTNPTNCGGGGGGGARSGYKCVYGTNGAGGLVEVCYPSDGSYGFSSATGGNICCTVTENGVTYCVHRFTSNGTFCIVS